MSQNRYYSNTAVVTSLTAGITASQTSITVAATTGFPASYPYTLVLDQGQIGFEIIEVSAAAGLTLTVTRGVDGTSPVAHSLGASVNHDITARDLDEPQKHIAAASAVHGLSGSVVGTSDTQALTNKTLDGTGNTFLNVPLSGITPTPANAVHTHVEADTTSLVTDLASKQATSEKGAASGYAGLDASALVPIAQLPAGTSGTQVAFGNHTHNLAFVHSYGGANPIATSGSPNKVFWNDTFSVTANYNYLVIATFQGIADQSTSGGRVQVDLASTNGSIVYRSFILATTTSGYSDGGLIIGVWTPATTSASAPLSLNGTWLSGDSVQLGSGHFIVIPISAFS